MEKKEYPVRVVIATLRFGEGGGEKEEYTYLGRVCEGAHFVLCYESEEGEERQKTELSFDSQTPEPMSLRQSGTVFCELRFDTKHPYKTLYRVQGAGEIDMEIRTRSLGCERTATGWRIRLDYETVVGGVRMRTVMTLTVTPS